jgi:hypothetical protein
MVRDDMIVGYISKYLLKKIVLFEKKFQLHQSLPHLIKVQIHPMSNRVELAS